MNNFLENNIVRFVQILRSLGLNVGTSETMDALSAVQEIKLTDRKQFQAALKATLVKDIVYAPLFEQAFDAFFVNQEGREHQLEQKNEFEEVREQARNDLLFQDQTLQLDDRYVDMYARLPEETQQRIRDFLEKTSQGKNVSAKFQPIVENVIRGALNYQQAQGGSPPLIPVEPTGDEELDAVLYQIRSEQKEAGLFLQDMAAISEGEYDEALVLIRKLARRLATKMSRRYRQSAKASRIDIRRSLRAGLRYGGVLLDLKYRQKRLTKPEIVFLCDVSGSMLKYSGFTLQFFKGLSDSFPQMKAFTFADQLETIDLNRFSFQELTGSKNWGEGTNLFNALSSLEKNYPRLFQRSTVLVILSDTKSTQPDLAARCLEKMAQKTKEIVWLNPLPGSQWEKHPTVALFSKYVTMWECSSLALLSRALSHQFG